MQHYGINWARFLEMLPRWEKLPVAARRVAIDELRPTPAVDLTALSGQGKALFQSGLAEPDSRGSKAKLADGFRGAMTAMRAMDRFKVFDSPPPLDHYLSWEFSYAECGQLLRHGRQYGDTPRLLAAKAECKSWVETFLTAGSEEQWLGKIIRPEPGKGLEDPAIFAATQRLVRLLLPLPQPLPFREIVREFNKGSPVVLAAAIRAAIANALLFAALREADLEPVLGIWPAITQRLHRAPAKAPTSLEKPPEVFCAAWWMEDMTCLVASAAQEPLRLRADDSAIFSRQRDKMGAQFMELPDWLAGLCKDDSDRRPKLTELPARLELAQRAARYMGLTKTKATKSRQTFLVATPEGLEWLALPPRDRLGKILHEVTGDRPRRGVIAGMYYDDGVLSFLPGGYRIEIAGRPYQPREEMASAFAALGVDQFFDADAFTSYQSQCHNPVLDIARRTGERGQFAIRSGWTALELTEVQVEACWENILWAFIWQRLLPLGGATIGRPQAPDGGCALALTDAGRYLLGLCDDFDYGRPARAALVVQPNFDVVFLSSDPVLEATCSRFAERLGGRQHVGTLFRITRSSITTAAAVGVALDHVLATLAHASTKPLPANVEQEVRGWFASFRSLRLRPATLIECPDAQTASRVLACAGAEAARISDVIVEFRGSGTKLDLVKALRAQGLFVN